MLRKFSRDKTEVTVEVANRWWTLGPRCAFQVIVDELVDPYMFSCDDGHAANARPQSDLTESLRLVASKLQKNTQRGRVQSSKYTAVG